MICGIDEAGRGCVAGSLFIAAVALERALYDSFAALGIKDSKKLSFDKRNKLERVIKSFLESNNGFYKIVSFSANHIDSHGLGTSIKLGLQNLYDAAKNKGAKEIIFDGNSNFNIQGLRTMIKGDSKHALIAAASILAKCEKDREMLAYDKILPYFDFKNNKGYLTKIHKEKIKIHGYSDIHRKSYNIKIL